MTLLTPKKIDAEPIHFMELAENIFALRTWWRCRSYKPRKLTYASILEWLHQFPSAERHLIRRLTKYIVFVSEDEFTRGMRDLNNRLLEQLAEDGVESKNVIYISFDDAGSSSAVVLNLVRDLCRLERRGCKLKDGRDIRGIADLTAELKRGAIVYVDDFSGSGVQFIAARDWLRQHVIGNFSEFFLVHTLCEEGQKAIAPTGVDARPIKVHTRHDRPLHPVSPLLPAADRNILRNRCLQMDNKGGLGYQGMASMVVMFRNTPNTVPLIFRGHLAQNPIKGIFPRTTDLPVKD